MNKPNYTIITPFKRWTIQNFPFIEEDFDAITNYQLLCKIVEYLNKVIENEKLLEQANNELIDAFNNLKDYVDNYFANLDVQDEIDNKLDEMAESGQLTDIIAQYLGLAGVLAFDTIDDMSDAENITKGSICYCLGDDTYDDGKGAFYKIRTVTSGDVVDGFNIVALDVSETLIAERIPNYYINQLNTEITNINNRIDNLGAKKYIFIGDSYNTTDTPQGGTQIVPWSSKLVNYLGLTSSDYYNSGVSGAGWHHGTDYLTQLQALDESITNKNEITDIIVLGGINDLTETTENIFIGIRDFATYVKTNYPNAMITIGIISWTRSETERAFLRGIMQTYNNCSIFTNVRVIHNSYTWYHNYQGFQADNHPNQLGSENIAYFLANYLKGGFDNVKWYKNGYIKSTNNGFGISTENIGSFYEMFNGDVASLKLQLNSSLAVSGTINISGTKTKLGELTLDTINISASTPFIVLTNFIGWVYYNDGGNKFKDITGRIILEGNSLYLIIETTGDNITNPSLMSIHNSGVITIPAEYC